jgi:hypothetical protein
MTCDLCGMDKNNTGEYSPIWVARCMEDNSLIFGEPDFPYDLCPECSDRIRYAGEGRYC